MNKTITACVCGSIDFLVTENITHRASIDPSNALYTLNISSIQDNSIEEISCSKCQKHYQIEDFVEIEFNN